MKTPGQLLFEVLAEHDGINHVEGPAELAVVDGNFDLELVAQRFISKLALSQTSFPLASFPLDG